MTEADRARLGLLAALIVAAVALCCAQSNPAVHITSGTLELYMDGEQPRLRLARPDLRISRQHPGNETIGLLFEPQVARPLRVTMVHYLPAAPPHLGSGFKVERVGSTVVLRSEPEMVSSARYFDFSVEQDDPLGKYRVEVYVDDELAKVVEFEVVP